MSLHIKQVNKIRDLKIYEWHKDDDIKYVVAKRKPRSIRAFEWREPHPKALVFTKRSSAETFANISNSKGWN